MLIIAILFFAFAALLGMYLLAFILQNKNTPKGVAFTHGLLAAIGLIILIMYTILNPSWMIISVVLFIFAAIGGLVLIYRDIFGKSIPKWMAMGHGLLAIVAFLLVIIIALLK